MRRRVYSVTDAAFLDLVARVLQKRAPGRAGLLLETRERRLDNVTREELRGILADELVEAGLAADSEPNAHGLMLEATIDWLGNR